MWSRTPRKPNAPMRKCTSEVPVSRLSDPHNVRQQYREPSNLNARVELHTRFSVNQPGWFPWVFDQLDLPSECTILELGCGTGELWLQNLQRVPRTWRIVLSDVFPGMLKRAEDRLCNSESPFSFLVADAQSIPCVDRRFDAVLANHMLYHVPDRAKALSEIWRVLRPGGHLYAATNGRAHLRTLIELVEQFDTSLQYERGFMEEFQLESGGAQLSPWFSEVTCRRYNDALLVTEVEPLVDYVMSGLDETGRHQRAEFRRFAEQQLILHGGTIRITKDVGIFIARRT